MKLLIALLLVLPLAAAEIDPPVAWSNESVTLRATVPWSFTCPPQSVSAAVAGRIITITVVAPQPAGCTPVQPVIGAWTVTAAVGPLAPGVYEVRTKVVAGANASDDLVRMLHVRDAEATFTVAPQVLIHSMREVELRSDDGRPFCAAGTACSPVVTIAGKPASIVRRDPGAIVVALPNDVGFGTHDVTLKEGESSSTSRAALTIARSGNVPPSLTERILIPVFWAGAGAHGSIWTTDVWFRNENLYGVLSTDQTIGICTSLISPCPYFPLDHDYTLRLEGQRGPHFPSGLQLFVPRGSAAGLHATALVRDLTRQSEAIGTELPIVYDDDFFSGPFSLVRVPVSDDYRTALRIYGTGGGTVRLVIYAIDEGNSEQAFVSQEMNLQGSNDPRVPPSIVIPDLAAQFPRLREIESGMVRIYLRSADRLWAFASVTNNSTQHVTNIRPQ